MIEELNITLDRLSRNLFRGSLNYNASFLVVRCKDMAGEPLEKVLADAIGNAVTVGGSESATESDVVEAMRSALAYLGDNGSHPSREYMASATYVQDTELAASQLKTLLNGASLIISFWLKEGHPFYPVYWDFAFAAEQNNDTIVIIGSSSD